MRGKKRPTADKARAVGIAVVDGASAASRATGIPRPTIIGWMDEPQFDELRQRKQEVVEQEWDVGIQLGFRRAVELLQATDDPVKAATTAAIMYDKLALRRGNVTSRSEVSTFHGYNDHEKRAIADLLRQALAGDGAPAGTTGDAEGAALVGTGTPGADSAGG